MASNKEDEVVLPAGEQNRQWGSPAATAGGGSSSAVNGQGRSARWTPWTPPPGDTEAG